MRRGLRGWSYSGTPGGGTARRGLLPKTWNDAPARVELCLCLDPGSSTWCDGPDRGPRVSRLPPHTQAALASAAAPRAPGIRGHCSWTSGGLLQLLPGGIWQGGAFEFEGGHLAPYRECPGGPGDHGRRPRVGATMDTINVHLRGSRTWPWAPGRSPGVAWPPQAYGDYLFEPVGGGWPSPTTGSSRDLARGLPRCVARLPHAST